MARSAHEKLRVLSIAHTAVNRTAGRLRYRPLGDDPSLAVRLIVPSRWFQFGRWYHADAGDEPGIAVRRLPIRIPRAGPANWYLHFYPGLGREVRAFAPDVIHLWEEPWSLVALHASRLAAQTGAALVLEIDQNLLKRLPPPFETIRRHVLRRTDLILSRSREAAEVARACGYTGPHVLIGYGVDQTLFYPAGKRAFAPPLRIGYVGRLVREKGIDDVLAAMADWARDVVLTIVGEGPHETELRRHVARAGLDARVSFQRWGDAAMVAGILREIDVLVLPTRTTAAVREQFGRVIIEAQACGTPVIGSSGGAIPAVIGDGGWVVPEGDPAAIGALLNRLSHAPDEIRARAAAAIENVRDRFTYDGVANELAKAWHQAHALRECNETERGGRSMGRGMVRAETR